MSEEEIIKRLKDTISLFNGDTHCFTYSDNERVEAMQGLLDLYQKEKEKNKELEDKIKRKIKIRKEEKAECKDSIEANLILREIYVLEELLEERN